MEEDKSMGKKSKVLEMINKIMPLKKGDRVIVGEPFFPSKTKGVVLQRLNNFNAYIVELENGDKFIFLAHELEREVE